MLQEVGPLFKQRLRVSLENTQCVREPLKSQGWRKNGNVPVSKPVCISLRKNKGVETPGCGYKREMEQERLKGFLLNLN